MHRTNQTMVTYFIIKGISDVVELQVLIFLLVLLIYLLTLGGNMTILLLVLRDPQLHTPMYFFLGNLATIDMLSTTVTLHKVFSGFFFTDKTISHLGCMIQFYLFGSLTCGELFILMTMSYDRYVAICNPLHYHMVMNYRVCACLALGCWTCSFIDIMPHSIILSGFTCYHSIEIDHFFCDIVSLVKLACNDTSLLDLLFFVLAVFLATFPPLFTFISYVFIITAILRIRSGSGRRKAFYTCSSHLIVVVLLYGTLICQYLRPALKNSVDSNKLFSLFNTAAVPMLNPIIYSLKNKDVKSALRRCVLIT